jgi:two-component system chemotaxis sensor kinase CheA
MDPELLRAIWPVFSAEAHEQLEALISGVLELEAGTVRDIALLESVRRSAHSFKGSASSLGFAELEQLAHAIEDVLAGHDGLEPIPPDMAEATFKALAALENALDLGERGQYPQVARLEELLALLGASTVGPRPLAGPRRHAGADALLLKELWPLFGAEAREQLQAMHEILLEVERNGGRFLQVPDQLSALTELVRAVGRLSSTLGLQEPERLSLALESVLEVADPLHLVSARQRAAIAHGVEGLEVAVAELDQGALPRVSGLNGLLQELTEARSAGPAQAFPGSAFGRLQPLEEAVISLRSPGANAGRGQVTETARAQAAEIQSAARAAGAGAVAELAQRLGESFRQASEPGPSAARAVAAAAGALVELRQRLEAWSAPVLAAAEPPPAAEELEVEDTPVAARETPALAAAAAPGSRPEGQADASEESGAFQVDRQVRVSESTLDALQRDVETVLEARVRQERRAAELTRLQARLGGLLAQAHPALRKELSVIQRELGHLAQEVRAEADNDRTAGHKLRDELRDLRMVPASKLFESLQRTARELSLRLNRPVALRLSGGEVRVERRVLQELKNPLVHLVRNAVDHGIEPIEVRQAAGKPPGGTIHVAVEQRDARLLVSVSDDGGGLSLERIRTTAATRKILPVDQAERLDAEEAARLIFRPGFSTADKVTAISGRGVGLDVVHETTRRLAGDVEVDSAPGRGTRFTLAIPHTRPPPRG